VHEKSLRLPQLRITANHSISYTWKTSRAEIHPQILLKSQETLGKGEEFKTELKAPTKVPATVNFSVDDDIPF
jgi:hypothetical protein